MPDHQLPRIVVIPHAEPQLEDPLLYSGTTSASFGSYMPLPTRRSIPSPLLNFSSKRRNLNLDSDLQARSRPERRPNSQQKYPGDIYSYSVPACQPSHQYPHHGQQMLRSALKRPRIPHDRRVVSFNPRVSVMGGDFIDISQAEDVETNMQDQDEDLLFDDQDSHSSSIPSSQWSKSGDAPYLKYRPRSVRYSSDSDIMEWLAGNLVEHEMSELSQIVIGGDHDELEAESYSMASLRPSLPIITTQTPAEDAFEYLISHGCPDLSSSLDLSQCSTYAIAGGRFGDVWQGKLNNNAVVAIKCLRLHAISAGSAKNVKRTARELYNWSKAKHLNVLELLGIAMFKGQLSMLSLWMENGTLSIYASLTPLEQRWSLCLQVTEGLTYMHNIGMVHGDLKAINILVSGEGVVKLSDFGNSILSDCSLGFTATSNIGGGTTRWMAPELFEDDVQRSAAADVYALGMTILEVMTSRVPYCERPSDISVLNAIMMGKMPARPTEIETDTRHGDQRWGILLSCWNKNPQKRVNCRAVRDKVRSFL